MSFSSEDYSQQEDGEGRAVSFAAYGKSLWGHFRRRYILLLVLIAVFVGLGVVRVALTPPEYIAVAVVGPASTPLSDMASSGGLGGALGSGLTRQLGLGRGSSDLFDRFSKLILSNYVAKRMAEDPHVLHAIFYRQYDWERHQWKIASGPFSDLKRWIKRQIHYPDNSIPGTDNVGKYLIENVSVDAPLTSSFITVTLKSDSPEKAKWLLNTLLLEADTIVREDRRRDVMARIVYLRKALPDITLNGQKDVLSGLLADQQQSMMTIRADKRYASTLIDPPNASSMPISPSLFQTLGLMILLAIGVWIALVTLQPFARISHVFFGASLSHGHLSEAERY